MCCSVLQLNGKVTACYQIYHVTAGLTCGQARSLWVESDEVFCSVLQCVAVCCSVLQCVAVCCSVLQCVAVCCSVLQCGVMGFNVL